MNNSIIIGLNVAAAAKPGTGAFASTEANQDIEIDLADDLEAFLELRPATDSGNERPDTQETDSTLELDCTGSDGGVTGDYSGFDAGAGTGPGEVFEVHNRGTQEVEVAVRTAEQDSTSTNRVAIIPSNVSLGGQNVLLTITAHDPPSGNPLDPVPLAPGEWALFRVTASVRGTITGSPPSVLDTDEITIQAEATQ